MLPPKGHRDFDHIDFARSPSEVRLLTCKNADDKMIAGEGNQSLAKPITERACRVQNGFIKTRI